MANLWWFKNYDKPIIPGHGLGRKESVVKFTTPLRAGDIRELPPLTTFEVNKTLSISNDWIKRYDQGQEGACVGFGWSWCMSILNRHFYAARKLYLEAQFIDPWSDTPPEEGTSVDAGATVLLNQGHWRFARGVTFASAVMHGIKDFRRANSVDDIRKAIYANVPVVGGFNWYSNFDSPQWIDIGKGPNRWWVGRGNLGNIRGGHCVCFIGARDDIEAVKFPNNWGINYPVSWMPYETLEQMIREGGDFLIPIDR
jgi:hypothetical protein